MAIINSSCYCVTFIRRGKIPQLMGDMAKGIKSFKRGMSDEEKKEDKNLENKNDEENNLHVFFWLE